MAQPVAQVERLESVADAHAKGVWAVAALPDAGDPDDLGQFVTGGCDGALRTWAFVSSSNQQKSDDIEESNGRDGLIQPKRVFERHKLPVVDVSVSRERGIAVSTSLDGVVKVWMLDAPASEAKSMTQPNVGDTWGISISRDGERAVTGGANGVVQVLDLQLCMVEQNYSTSGERPADNRGTVPRTERAMVMAVALRDDDARVVLGTSEGAVLEMDVETGKIISSIKPQAHGGPVRSVSYVSGERMSVVSAADDGLVCVHSVDDGTTTASLRGHAGMALAARPSPDGRCIASGGSDSTVKIWDRGERRSIFDSNAHSQPVWGVAWVRGGTHIVSVSDDGSIGSLLCRST